MYIGLFTENYRGLFERNFYKELSSPLRSRTGDVKSCETVTDNHVLSCCCQTDSSVSKKHINFIDVKLQMFEFNIYLPKYARLAAILCIIFNSVNKSQNVDLN